MSGTTPPREGSSQRHYGDASQPRSSAPNVLFVVLDTARSVDVDDRTMPTLTSLGTSGTTYERAFSSAPWTVPSHASLFTGTYTSRHGTHGGNQALTHSLLTLAECFAAGGYETVGVSNNTWITEEFGFARGFETFVRGWQYLQSETDVGPFLRAEDLAWKLEAARETLLSGNPLVNVVNVLYDRYGKPAGDDGAERTTRWIEGWLSDREDDRPFFCFLNYLEPHVVYDPPREHAETFLREIDTAPTGTAAATGTSAATDTTLTQTAATETIATETAEMERTAREPTANQTDADPPATYEAATSIRQDPRAFDVGAYDVSDREFALLRALYRGELRYVDDHIARLREALERAGEWEDTIVVVCGDHGENVGEHGFFGHQYNLHETVLHVPLVCHGGPFANGGTTSDLVQLLDLAGTLCTVAGIDDEAFHTQWQGQLLPTLDGTNPREAVYAEYVEPQPPMERLERRFGEVPPDVRRYDRTLRAIRTDRDKFVRGDDGSRWLWNLERDPHERRSLLEERPSRARRLEARLEQWLTGFEHAARDGPATMTAATEQRLSDLGYL